MCARFERDRLPAVFVSGREHIRRADADRDRAALPASVAEVRDEARVGRLHALHERRDVPGSTVHSQGRLADRIPVLARICSRLPRPRLVIEARDDVVRVAVMPSARFEDAVDVGAQRHVLPTAGRVADWHGLPTPEFRALRGCPLRRESETRRGSGKHDDYREACGVLHVPPNLDELRAYSELDSLSRQPE